MSIDSGCRSLFPSQTLRPLSTTDLHWISLSNVSYKLKESTPGCLPSMKRKTKKLHGYKSKDESTSLKSGNNDHRKWKQKPSFLNTLLAKLTGKKSPNEKCDDASIDSCKTDSSDKKRRSTSKHDEEFIFGGVGVFFNENGELCQRSEEEYDDDFSSMPMKEI